MTEYYQEDLAYIHDVGHTDFVLNAAPGLLDALARNESGHGLVVDLGCGSGLWARALTEAGYRVLGIDISAAMIDLARRRAPEAELRVESLFKAEIPPCNAVTSLGECLNYLFDAENDLQALGELFRRVHGALAPGGVFLFDVAEPGQVARRVASKGFSSGDDWVVLFEKEEDRERGVLTRRITSFRKVGEHYRRSEEAHCQRLYRAADVARELRRAGFRVRTMRSYGQYPLPKAHAAFLARKLA